MTMATFSKICCRLPLVIVLMMAPFSLGSVAAQDSPAKSPQDSMGLGNVEKLIREPFSIHTNKAKANLELILAYQELTSRAGISDADSTQHLSERLSDLQNQASTHLLTGIHQAVLLPHYASSGSGVYPLMDNAIAHFDSAAMHYDEVSRYAVNRLKQRVLFDGKFARLLGDTLKGARELVVEEQSFHHLEQINMEALIRRIYYETQNKTKAEPASYSLAHWIYEPFRPIKRQRDS